MAFLETSAYNPECLSFHLIAMQAYFFINIFRHAQSADFFCHWSLYWCYLLLIFNFLFILKRSPACGQASKGRHVSSWFVLVVHWVNLYIWVRWIFVVVVFSLTVWNSLWLKCMHFHSHFAWICTCTWPWSVIKQGRALYWCTLWTGVGLLRQHICCYGKNGHHKWWWRNFFPRLYISSVFLVYTFKTVCIYLSLDL